MWVDRLARRFFPLLPVHGAHVKAGYLRKRSVAVVVVMVIVFRL